MQKDGLSHLTFHDDNDTETTAFIGTDLIDLTLQGSDLGVSAPSQCNVVRCPFIRHYFTICFGLTGHLQVYRLQFRVLLFTVMGVSFLIIYFWLCGLHVVAFL
jgi:hypothetical protein